MRDRITTPFSATSTADDVIAGVRLDGIRAIVTGGGGGLGAETARALASAGAEVTIAVRDIAVGREAAAGISRCTGNAKVRAAILDLADQSSIRTFVEGWQGPLDILVNNAGIMATPEQRTTDGREMQFATNHLGHFALAVRLHAALASAARARIVVVSSVGHINGEVQFDDVDFDRHPYDPWVAYAQSKTANILFAVEAARRWAGDGITANALNPGRIFATGLTRHIESPVKGPASFAPDSKDVSVKTVPQGAATSVLLAASPLVDGVTGLYFEDCNEAEPNKPGVRRGVAAYALDQSNAGRLWQLSLELCAPLPKRWP